MLTADDCRSLINQLASKNRAPTLNRLKTEYPRFPQDFDKKEDKRIAAVFETLNLNIDVALPFLFEHVDDKRYSFTMESDGSGVWSNVSVGDTCALLIVDNIALYRSLGSGWTRHLKSGFPTDRGELKKWWKEQNGKPLWELQLHWLKWALEEEGKREFQTEVERTEVLKRLGVAIRSIEGKKVPLVKLRTLVFRPK